MLRAYRFAFAIALSVGIGVALGQTPPAQPPAPAAGTPTKDQATQPPSAQAAKKP